MNLLRRLIPLLLIQIFLIMDPTAHVLYRSRVNASYIIIAHAFRPSDKIQLPQLLSIIITLCYHITTGTSVPIKNDIIPIKEPLCCVHTEWLNSYVHIHNLIEKKSTCTLGTKFTSKVSFVLF